MHGASRQVPSISNALAFMLQNRHRTSVQPAGSAETRMASSVLTVQPRQSGAMPVKPRFRQQRRNQNISPITHASHPALSGIKTSVVAAKMLRAARVAVRTCLLGHKHISFEEMKTCTKCLITKHDWCFYVYTESDKHTTGKLHASCKKCQNEARANHRKENPILTSANARRCKIKRLFGITEKQYNDLLSFQSDVCAICKKKSRDGRRLHIDHNHTTKQVRGLLCHDCNRGIGIFKDDYELLESALKYIKDPIAPKVF